MNMNYGNLHRYSDNAVLRRASEDELVASLQALEEGHDCIIGPDGGPTGDGVVGLFMVEGESCYVSGFSEEALNSTGGVPDDWKLVQVNGLVVAFDFHNRTIVCPRCGTTGPVTDFPPNVVSQCRECQNCGYEGTDDPATWELQFVRQ